MILDKESRIEMLGNINGVLDLIKFIREEAKKKREF